jgi:hypothetical protein
MTTLLVDTDTLEDAAQLAIARANNLKEVDWWVNDIDLFEKGDLRPRLRNDDDDCEDDDYDCEDDDYDDDYDDDCEDDDYDDNQE